MNSLFGPAVAGIAAGVLIGAILVIVKTARYLASAVSARLLPKVRYRALVLHVARPARGTRDALVVVVVEPRRCVFCVA